MGQVSLGGNFFSNEVQPVTLVFTADPTLAELFGTFVLLPASSAFVTIGGTTTATFTGDEYGLFVNTFLQAIGFADLTSNFPIEYTNNAIANSYTAETSIDITGPTSAATFPFPTAAGDFIIYSVSGTSSFTANCRLPAVGPCFGVWNCSGCTPGNTITVTTVTTVGTGCLGISPTNVFPTNDPNTITVESTSTDQFYTVTCGDQIVSTNPDESGALGSNACTEEKVINAGGNSNDCVNPSAIDYLRTDIQEPYYLCGGGATCLFDSYPGTGVPYNYDVTYTDYAGSTVSTSADNLDCRCQNFQADDIQGSPGSYSCTNFTPIKITTTNPPTFGRRGIQIAGRSEGVQITAPGIQIARRSKGIQKMQRTLLTLNATHPERIPEKVWSLFF